MAVRFQTYVGRNFSSATAFEDQIREKLFRSVGPGDFQRDRRAVLFDDELKAKEAAALPLGVDDACDLVEKAGSWLEGQPVAVVERHAADGPCDQAWEKSVAAAA